MVENSVRFKHKDQVITISLKKPSKKVAIAYLEGRGNTEGGIEANVTDDGDEQIISCVTTHTEDETRALLARFPLLSKNLRVVFNNICQDDIRVVPNQTIVTPELKAKNPKVEEFLSYEVNGTPLIFSLVTRVEVKFFEREQSKLKRLPYKYMCGLPDAHVLLEYKEPYDQLCVEHPFLPFVMGTQLLSEGGVEVIESEGK